MQDYRLDKCEKNYVLSYEIDEEKNKNSLLVEFANDGRKSTYFENIAYNKENIEKLDSRMKIQIGDAIKNKERYILNKKKSFLISTTALVSTMASSIVAFNSENLTSQAISTSLFVVSIATLIYNLKKYRANSAKASEIDKAEYISKNSDILNNIEKYPNALVDSDENFREFVCSEKEPFKVNNFEDFTKKDLEKVVTNILREKEFNFIYDDKYKDKSKVKFYTMNN